MTDTTTNPTRWRLMLLALFAALALLASACGDDDGDSDTAPAAAESTAEDDMADEEMAEDDMAEEEMAEDEMGEEEMAEEGHEGLEDIRGELAAAGLDDDQIICVLDAAVAEWGADALVAPGQASDDQLLRLGELTFGCL